MLISVERAKDEPVLLDYSVFSLVSSFTMGLSFRRSKEGKRWEGKKQYNLCTKTGGRQNESEEGRREEESLTDREVKREKITEDAVLQENKKS